MVDDGASVVVDMTKTVEHDTFCSKKPHQILRVDTLRPLFLSSKNTESFLLEV